VERPHDRKQSNDFDEISTPIMNRVKHPRLLEVRRGTGDELNPESLHRQTVEVNVSFCRGFSAFIRDKDLMRASVSNNAIMLGSALNSASQNTHQVDSQTSMHVPAFWFCLRFEAPMICLSATKILKKKKYRVKHWLNGLSLKKVEISQNSPSKQSKFAPGSRFESEFGLRIEILRGCGLAPANH
jgi:hypothetical protein